MATTAATRTLGLLIPIFLLRMDLDKNLGSADCLFKISCTKLSYVLDMPGSEEKMRRELACLFYMPFAPIGVPRIWVQTYVDG